MKNVEHNGGGRREHNVPKKFYILIWYSLFSPTDFEVLL